MKNRRRRLEYIHIKKAGGFHRQKRSKNNILEVFVVSQKRVVGVGSLISSVQLRRDHSSLISGKATLIA